MTRHHEGIAGYIDDVMGAPVGYTPAGGATRTIEAIFRRKPVVVTGHDGTDVLITNPTLRIRGDLVPEIRRDDLIEVDSRTWRILNVWPQGSPAGDAHLICDLEGPVG